MTTRQDFAMAILDGLGDLVAAANVDALVAVMTGENTTAAWNPCATTMPWPGDSEFNSAGVRNYPTVDSGVAATLATLRNGRYPAVLAALVAGNDATATVRAWAESPWGTWSGRPDDAVATLATVQGDRARYYGTAVSGPASTSATPPPPPPPAPPATDTGELGFMIRTLEVTDPADATKSMTGQDIASVQVILNAKAGAGLAVDGVYWNATAGAVRNWQARHGLVVDGVVGPKTWPSIIEG